MRPIRSLCTVVVVGGAIVALVACTAVARIFLSADTLNATGALALPSWLDKVTQRSRIAYPAHAAVAAVLEMANLSPAATAVQWVKAAAHARSAVDVERTAKGIEAALARDGNDSRALRTLCTIKDLGDPSQVRAIQQASLACDHWPPNVALEAVVAPLQAKRGDVVNLTVSVTSTTDYAGLVDVEIHDGAERRLAQWVFADQQLAAGQPLLYAVEWVVPPTLPIGEYEVKAGVFSDGWATLRQWKNAAATILVTS
jgi:hypothetical protein